MQNVLATPCKYCNVFDYFLQLPYLQDLAMYPDNGWSWLGLLQIHQVGGTVDKEVVVAYKKAWASAETSIESSCPALSRNFASRKL